ncbi:hypothetical protein BX600DRAFT_366632, partial [Xylariales sp. PMI_506]
MEDTDWSWPAWKFGMTQDQLFTNLHDQYNTIPSAIQDPQSFHRDVYEISNAVSTVGELDLQLSERKGQRLRELNNVLELASYEIIANPNLIGTEQWQYAVHLFRSRSLDSLVQYFASYLPNEFPLH